MKSHQFLKTVVLYTLIFCTVLPLCFYYFFALNKAFFVSDGIRQHVIALAYLGEYVRQFFSSLFSFGKIEIPQFDFSLSLGADILTTLHYYSFGDPLDLLAAFFPKEHSYGLYRFLIFFRMFLSGIAFLVWCRRHKLGAYASLCGALIYVFCGFTFYCGPRHPYFINPMIWLPLLCLGIDLIIEEGKPVLFAVCVWISCMSNFYFFYMLSILVFVYALVRFCFVFGKSWRKELPRCLCTAMIAYITGVLLASAIFLPQIHGFLNSGRSDEGDPVKLFYRLLYYVRLPLSFIAPLTFGPYSKLGFATPALPIVAFALTRKDRKAKQVAVFLLIGLVFFLFPIFGSMFNGFNYATNRWCFGFSLIVAATTAVFLPEFISAPKKALRIAALASIALSLLVFAVSAVEKNTRTQLCASYVVLFAFSALLLLFVWKKLNLKFLVLPAIILSVIVNANVHYSPHGIDYLADFVDARNVAPIMQESMASFPIGDDDFFRVETSALSSKNSPALSRIKGTTYYWSENNAAVINLFNETALPTGSVLRSTGFNGRESFISLFNVKYLLKDGNDVPFGFFDTGKQFCGFEIWKNRNFLPFGLFYDTYISEHDFHALSPAEKNETLLVAATVPDGFADGTDAVHPDNIRAVPFEFEENPDIEIFDGKIAVRKDGAKLRIKTTGKETEKVYIFIGGIFYDNGRNKNPLLMLTNPAKYLRQEADTRTYETASLIFTDFSGRGTWFEVKADSPLTQKVLANLGFFTSDENYFGITFGLKGTYTFETFETLAVDYTDFAERVGRLKSGSLHETDFFTNGVRFRAETEKERLLCLSIPYSKGWHAKIDGKDAPLFKTQICLTGMMIPPGEHKVELRYSTPYLRLGMLLSLLGLVLLVLLARKQFCRRDDKNIRL